MEKKRVFKVTNNNIRLRFLCEHQNNPDTGLKEVAEMFGTSKQVLWKWTSKNPKYSNLPSKRKCPLCKESQHDRVHKWINSGAINHLIK